MASTLDTLTARVAPERPAAAGVISLSGDIEPLADTEDPGRGDGLGRGLRACQEAWVHVSLAASVALVLGAAIPGPVLGEALAGRHAGPLGARPAAAPAVVQLAGAPPATEAPEADDPAFRLQDLSPAEAQVFNSLIPFSTAPNPPAPAFIIKVEDPQDEARATACMTAAIYYEAATEPVAGQQAVAQVVLNRMRDPAYPKSICGVVFQGSELPTGWQFSFTGDGSLARKPSVKLWAQAHTVAVASLHGFVARSVGQATHYHAAYVAPYWTPRLAKVAAIGLHIFYRWLGARGMPAAFTGRYAGVEPYIPEVAALEPATTVAVEAPRAVVAEAPTPTVELAQAPITVTQVAQPAPPPTPAVEETPQQPPATTPSAAAMTSGPQREQKPANWSRLPVGSHW